MFNLEILGAKYGDCIIINYGSEDEPKRILVDGGPPGVYRKTLRPRINEIRVQQGFSEPVVFELAMVSHIDNDHIAGLLELTNEIIRVEGRSNDPAIIKRFWFNSFNDLTDDEEVSNASLASEAIVAAHSAQGRPPFQSLDGTDGRAEHILAGLGQGRNLRDNLYALGLDKNRPFNRPLILRGDETTFREDAIKFTVVSPNPERLGALREKWNPNLSPVEVAALTDKSVANLSSLVVLIEYEGKRVLLTGDARADDIIKDLTFLNFLNAQNETFHTDVLKVMHHGSNRNVDVNFFEVVTADNYVFCGDGIHDNPDWDTIEMLRTARPNGGYSVFFSNWITMEKPEKQPKFQKQIDALIEEGVTIKTRGSDDLFVGLNLIS